MDHEEKKNFTAKNTIPRWLKIAQNTHSHYPEEVRWESLGANDENDTSLSSEKSWSKKNNKSEVVMLPVAVPTLPSFAAGANAADHGARDGH